MRSNAQHLSTATLETGTCRAVQKSGFNSTIVGNNAITNCVCVSTNACAFASASMWCGFLICYELQLCFFIVSLFRAIRASVVCVRHSAESVYT